MLFRLEQWLKWPFNIPPLDEQRRIVELLDAASEQVTSVARQLALLKEEKRALMADLLTGKRCVRIPACAEEASLPRVTSPDPRAVQRPHPALHLLCNLGWTFLSTEVCLQPRGGTREVLMKPRLVEALLQARRFEYKGEWYPLSPSAIDQIVREISALNLWRGSAVGERAAGQQARAGVTVTEFMPDGKKHQPTIAVID